MEAMEKDLAVLFFAHLSDPLSLVSSQDRARISKRETITPKYNVWLTFATRVTDQRCKAYFVSIYLHVLYPWERHGEGGL